MKFARMLALGLGVWGAGETAFAGDETSQFTPANGFAGHSEGTGKLRLLAGKDRPFRVESHGYVQDDGTFRLDQTVFFEGEKGRDRFWIIETIHQGRYRGILSDAAGPVSGVTKGIRLTLNYRIKGPLRMQQKLEWMPREKTIENVGTIRLLGIPIGRLHETIRKME